MSHPARESLLIDEAGVRFGTGIGVLFVLSAAVAEGPLHGEYGVALQLLATVALSVWLDWPHALGLGLAGWAFATGFAVHTLGVLTLGSADLLRMSVFVLAAAATSRAGDRG